MTDPLIAEIMEQLAGQIDKRLDKRLGAIERHIDAVGKEIEIVAGQVAFLLNAAGVKVNREEGTSTGEAIAQVDETWQCIKCGSRLGYYDPNDDVLRVRHKDLVFWVSLGIGGKFSIVCRSCGELNSVSWSAPDEEKPAG